MDSSTECVYLVQYDRGSNYFGADSATVDSVYFKDYACAVACAGKMVTFYFAESRAEQKERMEYHIKKHGPENVDNWMIDYETEPSREDDSWTWGGEFDSGPAHAVYVTEIPIFTCVDPSEVQSSLVMMQCMQSKIDERELAERLSRAEAGKTIMCLTCYDESKLLDGCCYRCGVPPELFQCPLCGKEDAKPADSFCYNCGKE